MSVLNEKDCVHCGYPTINSWSHDCCPDGIDHKFFSEELQVDVLRHVASTIHELNKTWWHDPATGLPKERNVGEMLMLVVSEIAEAMEGHRKHIMDDKLPERAMIEVELADAVIRIMDISAGLHLDLGGAIVEKLAYNAQRADHKPEARLAPGGKKY